jgi:6-phosphogluconolactonase
METIKLDSSTEVAERAASDAVTVLAAAIEARGSATWVLAGGSSPMAAYAIIVDKYADALDWSRVSAVIGDERMVAVEDPASNWGAIFATLLSSPKTAAIVGVQPSTDVPAGEAAALYSKALAALETTEDGTPIFDLVWLGVGEDGHTLSLFPGHPDFVPTDDLVIAVHNSPKPPPTRLTVTIRSLRATQNAVVFATGAGKKDALALALAEGTLPIAQVSAAIEASGGVVTWLFDPAAWSDEA